MLYFAHDEDEDEIVVNMTSGYSILEEGQKVGAKMEQALKGLYG
ncbi:cold shock-like protein CspG domain protein [Peptostreptococcaceae bacterium oral taxon 113 str. W5053]|nr:cold shock-like protein CspG domain protein [Peptostreptococcaceae bacterium oral taxon 113 str. W5053]